MIVLQEHRPVENEEQSTRRKNRNRYSRKFCFQLIVFFFLDFSLKDFICDSSSSSSSAADDEDEDFDPAEFYPKVNRLIDQDLRWRKSIEYQYFPLKSLHFI